MRGTMRSALQAAGVSKYHYPRERHVPAASPAFVAMALVHHEELRGELNAELRQWYARSGKLWRAWKRLSAEAKVAMVRCGRKLQQEAHS